MRVFNRRTAVDYLDARIIKRLDIKAVEAINFLVFASDEFLPVKACLTDAPAVALSTFKIFRKIKYY